MAVIKAKPTSPGRRFVVKVVTPELHKGAPHKPLLEKQSSTGGRNNAGRVSTRHRGGGHKHHYRIIDFKRNKDGVPGAWELGATAALVAGEGVSCVIALGAVVRGETPHFDFVAGETARALAGVAVREMIPVGFGLLTTDTMEQALARAGGSAGNKGYEAAEAALRSADLHAQWLDHDD